MTPVECYFVTPEGNPVINTAVEIEPSKSGYEEELDGIVMPRPVSTVTDAQGKVTVELWPGPIVYHVTVYDTESDVGLHYKFIVPVLETPGMTVRLQDIVVDGELSGKTWDEAALLSIHEAKANAMASAGAAKASELAAAASANGVGVFADAAAASAASALASKNASGTSQVAAKASEDASKASEMAGKASEVLAKASEIAADASMQAAAISQTNAGTSAAAALQSKQAAAASEAVSVGLAPHFGPTPQANPVANAEWIDSDTGRRYTWLVDANSSQWVETGAVVAVGSDTAVAAAGSAAAAAASVLVAGFKGASVDVAYNLIITRADGTTYNAGYVRGPQGAAFTVEAVGANLAARNAYDSQPVGFSFLDTSTGSLYFRQGAAGGWSPAIPFGKGEKGDTGTTDFNALFNKPVLGTAAALNVAASGNAGAGELVKGSDSRLSDSRAPTAHTHTLAQLSDASAAGRAFMQVADTNEARTLLAINNVENTSDLGKPISTAQAAVNATKASKAGETFTGKVTTAPSSQNYAAELTLNAVASNVFYISPLTGPCLVMPTNGTDGQTINIRLQQDAVGGRVVSFNAGVKVAGYMDTGINRVSWLILTWVAPAARWEGAWSVVPA